MKPKDTPVYVSDTPGYISETDLKQIESKLEAEGPRSRGALRILREFSTENVKEPHEVWEVIAAIRHLVYDLELKGGPKAIEESSREAAIAQQNVEYGADANKIVLENGEQFAERMRVIRTFIALKALATLSGEKINGRLGMIRARFKKPDPEHKGARKYIDLEAKKNIRAITDRVPTDELLDIVRLAEEKHPDAETETLVSLARGSALEFLIRRLITSSPKLIQKASKFFTSRYIEAVLDQMPDSLADGRIGGKATGVLLAYAALENKTPEFDDQFAKDHGYEGKTKEFFAEMDKEIELKENRSHFIGSNIFEQVIDSNPGVADSAMIKRLNIDGKEVPDELHAKVEENMLKAKFPGHLERQLWILFKKLHGKPIIARSSSELEDRIGASFAGKYDSVELANSSDKEKEDFEKFKDAILQIYATVFRREVMEYRKEHDLLINDEEMGILGQDLNGDHHNDYFYPDFAGVAMSYATQSIGFNPKRGAMTIVAGLGEQAVDEGGRFVMLANPKTSRSETDKTQSEMVVIDTKNQKKIKISPRTLIQKGSLSQRVERYGIELDMDRVDGGFPLLTCKELVQSTNIPLKIEYMIQKLKHQLGYNVDCEFTIQSRYDTEEKKWKWVVKLVQCRPQNIPKNLHPSRMPGTVSKDRILLSSMKGTNATSYKNIPYILYIDPKIFSNSTQHAGVHAYVNAVNQMLGKGDYLIVAPKRWGSKDLSSGINVNFAEFSRAAGYMEIFPNGGTQYSWGTHFFQNTMDAEMAVGAFEYEGTNDAFLRGAPNTENIETKEGTRTPPEIPDILKPYVKLIDVNQAYRQGKEDKSEDKWVLHVAQDNTGTEGVRPSNVYIAKYGKELPEAILEEES